ncbi:hypothetical protein V1511DRAFT_265921 [Dipodascopsis uninucleata]
MEFSETVVANKEPSKLFQPTHSATGKYIATITKTVSHTGATVTDQHYKVVIYSSRSLKVKRQLSLPLGFVPKFVKWYTNSSDKWDTLESDGSAERLLVADDTGQIRVWDIDYMVNIADSGIDDLKYVVTIQQANWGSNISIKNVDWGRSPDEILVFSDFQVVLAIWSIEYRQSFEIFCPKFISTKGYSYQPGSRHFTLLTRPVSEDTISIYGGPFNDLKLISSFGLSEFFDVKGFKWSPDGRWIAAYDNITNFQVGIFTPLGELYRVFSLEDIGLGVSDIEWSPTGTFLAVSTYDGLVHCLNTLTFTPSAILRHNEKINPKERVVFVEQPINSKEGYSKYQHVKQYPVSPPKIRTSLKAVPPKTGVSITEFNCNGTIFATKYDLIPTTLWIWSLENMSPLAILVHVRAIKYVEFHPQDPHLLLIVCNDSRTRQGENFENYDMDDVSNANDCAVRVWNAKWRNTVTFSVPKTGKFFTAVTDACWMSSTSEIDPDTESTSESTKVVFRNRILICDKSAFVVGYLDSDLEPEDDETRVQRLIDGVQQQEWAESNTGVALDDTFAMLGQRPVRSLGYVS